MNAKNYLSLILCLGGLYFGKAQERTTVTANSVDISDNLDLRAVASIFGESRDLEDFERRLNDPRLQISNLDMNNDNQVDYLRVIEIIEGNVNLIIIQAVLGRDVFQDVATIDVERDQRNNVVVQVVGDTFLYGHDYIFEPVFVQQPIIFSHFWIPNRFAYTSPWFWNFYPTFFNPWVPFPIIQYHNHINVWINYNNTCGIFPFRRSTRAIALHQNFRGNGWERQHPNRAFAVRNSNVINRHELVKVRDNSTRATNIRSTEGNSGTRGNGVATRDNNVRNNSVRSNNVRTETPRTNYTSVRDNNVRSNSVRSNNVRTETPKTNYTSVRDNSVRSNSVRSNNVRTETPKTNYTSVRDNSVRSNSVRSNNVRTETPKTNYTSVRDNNVRSNSVRSNNVRTETPATNSNNIRNSSSTSSIRTQPSNNSSSIRATNNTPVRSYTPASSSTGNVRAQTSNSSNSNIRSTGSGSSRSTTNNSGGSNSRSVENRRN